MNTKLCKCGCGLTVSIYRGKPREYRKGHWMKNNKYFAEQHRKAMTGPNNPQYGKFGQDHPAYGHATKPEVREQRRQRRLNALHQSRTSKKTSIEKSLSKILSQIKVVHKPQHIIYKKFSVDEFLPEYNLVIEAYGGYWHSDPRRFPKISQLQLRIRAKDLGKIKYLVKSGHRVLILWEEELIKHPEWCRNEIVLAIKDFFIPDVQDSIQGKSFYRL